VAFIEQGISFLAPDRELSEPFGYLKSLQDMPHLKFAGKVSYKDAKANSYDEPFAIDLTYIKTQSYIGKTTVEERLKEIEKTLERLGETLEKPLLVRHISEAEYQKQEKIRAQEVADRRAAFKFVMVEAQAKVPPQNGDSPGAAKADDSAKM
jgi:hypothetical protein